MLPVVTAVVTGGDILLAAYKPVPSCMQSRHCGPDDVLLLLLAYSQVMFLLSDQCKPVNAHPLVVAPIVSELHLSQVPNAVASATCELGGAVEYLASVLASKER